MIRTKTIRSLFAEIGRATAIVACIAAFLCVALSAPTAEATQTTFSYTQTDSLLGVGTIAPFTYDDGGGPISFTATPMPLATVVNPNPLSTPVGFIGAQTLAAGDLNEANTVVGLTFTGSVLATGTRGANVYTMAIPLRFVPEVNQTPDVSDYTWNVTYGDSLTNDAASTSMRFAMWLSRDTVADSTATPNTFQRYTQLNHTFAAGTVDSFSNTNTTNTTIKDATDVGGDPQGVDAAGRDLAFYFGWRDQGALNAGAILVNDFTIGGLLNTDDASLTLIPEPGTVTLVIAGLASIAVIGLRRRRQ